MTGPSTSGLSQKYSLFERISGEDFSIFQGINRVLFIA
jgi:hypothetical protein